MLGFETLRRADPTGRVEAHGFTIGTIGAISLMIFWLVVWNISYDFPYIGNVIIPTDLHIFQRGRAQQPTTLAVGKFYSRSGPCDPGLTVSLASQLHLHLGRYTEKNGRRTLVEPIKLAQD